MIELLSSMGCISVDRTRVPTPQTFNDVQVQKKNVRESALLCFSRVKKQDEYQS